MLEDGTNAGLYAVVWTGLRAGSLSSHGIIGAGDAGSAGNADGAAGTAGTRLALA